MSFPRSGASRVLAPILAALAAVPLSLTGIVPAAAVEPVYEEFAGSDRFETSAIVAGYVAPARGGTVIVATGADYPDALAAGPVGGLLRAPVLLTAEGRLDEAVRGVLQRHAPERILIVGGQVAVPVSVEGELRELAPQARVLRYGGRDRQETAALVAEAYFPEAEEVFVATGWNFPDALSAGAVAAVRGAPVLLGSGQGLGEAGWAAMERIAPERYWLVGGERVLGHNAPPAGLAAVHERIAGADRYATNAALVDRFFPQPTGTVIAALGSDFPDALVAAPLAAVLGAPLVLTTPECSPEPVAASARRLLADGHPELAPLTVLVGSGVRPGAEAVRCES